VRLRERGEREERRWDGKQGVTGKGQLRCDVKLERRRKEGRTRRGD